MLLSKKRWKTDNCAQIIEKVDRLCQNIAILRLILQSNKRYNTKLSSIKFQSIYLFQKYIDNIYKLFCSRSCTFNKVSVMHFLKCIRVVYNFHLYTARCCNYSTSFFFNANKVNSLWLFLVSWKLCPIIEEYTNI